MKKSPKSPASSGRVGVLEAVGTPLKFFTLVCLVVEGVFAGLALKLSGNAQATLIWGMIGTLALLIVSVALMAVFRPASLGTPVAAASPGQPAFAEAICGQWWQLVHHHPELAVSYVEIRFLDGYPFLEGTVYDQTGKRVGSWKSEGACVNQANREVFYFWKGDEFSKESLFKDFSGIGSFNFRPPSEGGKSERGDGWFTTGHLAVLTADMKRKGDIRRVSEAELKRISGGESVSKIAAEVYAQWSRAHEAVME